MSHLAQDGSGDLDIGELNNVLASISGGAMSAGNDHKTYDDDDQMMASTMTKTFNESMSSTHPNIPPSTTRRCQCSPATRALSKFGRKTKWRRA
jgi:hypothetical protein